MALSDRMITKLNTVLARFNVTDRVVSKRVTSTAGGDPLTGRGSTPSNIDTVLDPQPSVQVASKAYPLVVAGQQLSPDAEYLVTASVTSLSRSDVVNPALSIIFTDSSGAVEELFIVGFSPIMLNGVDVAFDLVLSSKKR